MDAFTESSGVHSTEIDAIRALPALLTGPTDPGKAGRHIQPR